MKMNLVSLKPVVSRVSNRDCQKYPLNSRPNAKSKMKMNAQNAQMPPIPRPQLHRAVQHVLSPLSPPLSYKRRKVVDISVAAQSSMHLDAAMLGAAVK